MTAVKTIRALERGLHVMQTLEGRQSASLEDIHRLTGLPRATLLRILKTLEAAGMVRRGIGDARYRNTFRLQRLAGTLDRYDRLAEVAAPVLDRLCRKVKWPSDLIVMNDEAGDHLEIKETSRPHSPFTVNRDHIGFQINLPLSAVGRSYLAFCGAAERESLLAELGRSDHPHNRLVRLGKRFVDILDAIRAAGHATRDPSFYGGNYATGELYDDGMAAIAVPLRDGERIFGCVNLVWLRSAAREADMVAAHLDDLAGAAREIVDAYVAGDTPV